MSAEFCFLERVSILMAQSSAPVTQHLSFDDPIRPHEHGLRNRQADLISGL